MTGAEKAAILLYFAGPEISSKVFIHLEDDEIRKISQAMTKLGHVSLDTVSFVVDEYSTMVDPEAGIFAHGDDYVRKVLTNALGPTKAEVMLQEIYSVDNEDIIDILANMDAKTVANFLSQEHPQTIAVVLAKLRPKQTGEIIGYLPTELQATVVMRIADIDQVSPDILAEVEEEMRRELTSMGGVQRSKVGGIDKVVDLFKHLDRSREKQILDHLDTLKPPLSEVIRKHLLTFDDIFLMDGRSIQQVLREVQNDVLTLAMKTAGEDIKEKVFENISARAAEAIKEDLDSMGPVRLADVEKAQSEIIKVVRKLEEEGRVVLGRGGDDVLV